MGVAYTVLAVPLAVEHSCRSEDQRFAPLDFVGIIVEALRLEVAELPGIFLQGGIGGNQPIDLCQSDQSQVAVGSERLEQGELSFLFHDSKSFYVCASKVGRPNETSKKTVLASKYKIAQDLTFLTLDNIP